MNHQVILLGSYFEPEKCSTTFSNLNKQKPEQKPAKNKGDASCLVSEQETTAVAFTKRLL